MNDPIVMRPGGRGNPRPKPYESRSSAPAGADFILCGLESGGIASLNHRLFTFAPTGARETVHVKFKDHPFFVPDSKGLKARAQGVPDVVVLTKEEADHQESEGAVLKRSSDGTVKQVSFIASGVELEK